MLSSHRFADFAAWRNAKVLDLGAGLGTETVNFARAGAHVVAVDLSQVSLTLLRKRCEHESLLGQVRVVCGNYEELDTLLPGEMGTFDLVWAFGSFHHTSHPAKAMAQAWAALKPGGQLRAMVYSKLSWKRFDLLHHHGPWTPGRDGDATVEWHSEAAHGSPITYSFSLRQARDLCLDAGFVEPTVRKAHIFRYKIAPYQEGRYELRDEWANVSASDLLDLEAEMGWHTLVKALKPT